MSEQQPLVNRTEHQPDTAPLRPVSPLDDQAAPQLNDDEPEPELSDEPKPLNAPAADLFTWATALMLVRRLGARLGPLPAEVAEWLVSMDKAVDDAIARRTQ